MAAYIKRQAEAVLERASGSFGAVLVTGARQTGKTTLLTRGAGAYRYVTLDDPLKLNSAALEGETFFEENPPPVIVDEIQYAPGLFPYIKMILDRGAKPGSFLMSGSQQFRMMKNVSESLAGRVGIMTLLGFSLREIKSISFNKPFLPDAPYFKARQEEALNLDFDELWNIIHQGAMPRLYQEDEPDWEFFWGAYTKTYLERDLRDLTQVGDEQKFLIFMSAIAARTGQLLNLSSVSQDVGISVPTAERWLSILVTSNLVFLLRPFQINTTKRMIKAPKLYFLDTGLAAYLTKWTNQEVLRNGHMAGAFFETFVIAEIIKSYTNDGKDAPLYFYRDRDGREIDLVLWQNGVLHPLEIKKHANPDVRDIKAFEVLDGIDGFKRGPGGVICLYKELQTLKGNDKVIPLGFL